MLRRYPPGAGNALRQRNFQTLLGRTAWNLGKRVGKEVQNFRSRRNARTSANRTAPAMVPGAYGTVKRALRKRYKKSRKSKRSKKSFKKYRRKFKNFFASYGFENKVTVTGAVNDPNAVYLAHQTNPAEGTLEFVVASLIRKLFKKAVNINITDVNQVIANASGTGATAVGWRIELFMRNPADNFEQSNTYDFGVNETIKSLVGDVGNAFTPTALLIMNAFKNFSAGSGSVGGFNTLEPVKFTLYNNDGTNWDKVGDINLKNELVVYYASSNIRVQNRTKSDNATDLANDITHNPIHGKVYDLHGPVPKLKIETGWQMETMNALSGINLQRAATFASSGQQTLPPTSIFRNLKGTQTIKLDPGQMQQCNTIHVKGTKTLHNFLRALHIGQFSLQQTNMVIGKSQLIVLMDELNFAKTQKVTVVYEVERMFKCYLRTGATDPAQGSYIQYTSSNTA